jgi:hypothetical protein
MENEELSNNLTDVIILLTIIRLLRILASRRNARQVVNQVDEDEVSSNTEVILSPNLIRHYPFGNVKKQIIKSCMESIDSLLNEIFDIFGIYHYKIYSTVYDKIGNSRSSNLNFYQMEIKYIYNNSVPNKVKNKEKYLEHKRQILYDILLEEKNNSNKEIKVLNAIFNLPYLDFLKAYLNDEAKVIIKNDINAETEVCFTKGNINQNSSNESILNFNFETYRDFYKYKYDKNQRIEFKEKMMNTFLGKKRHIC